MHFHRIFISGWNVPLNKKTVATVKFTVRGSGQHRCTYVPVPSPKGPAVPASMQERENKREREREKEREARRFNSAQECQRGNGMNNAQQGSETATQRPIWAKQEDQLSE